MPSGTRGFLASIIVTGLLVGSAGCGSELSPDSSAVADGEELPPVVEDELILIAVGGADPQDIADLVAANGAVIRSTVPEDNLYLLGVDPDQREAILAALALSPLVDEVAENFQFQATRLPNDAEFNRQTYLTTIEAPAAWDITTGDADIIVAVLDTGVDDGHPDLIANRLDGWNVFQNNSDAADVHGHGTKVAGIIAAGGNNGTGVASLVWNGKLLPVRISDSDGLATSYRIAAAMRWATDHDARVLNISFAPLYWDRVVARQAALSRLQGAVVVIASGNSGFTSRSTGTSDILFVGATDSDDVIADFSNRGPFIDLVAPGVNIYTTMRNGKYGGWSGTSFSAPIVSGVAALILAVNPDLRPATVESILLDTAEDLGDDGKDSVYGAGRINARRAVREARTREEADDDELPVVTITSPADGSQLSEAFRLRARATDNDAIADVLLSIDDTLIASDPLSPYRFVLNPDRYASGSHTLSLVAVDVSGNVSVADEITVEFVGVADSDGPTVTITSPANNATIDTAVASIVNLVADAADDRGLAAFEVIVDGLVVDSGALVDITAGIVFNWDTASTTVAAGVHTLSVRVTDTSGNQATASVRVNVSK